MGEMGNAYKVSFRKCEEKRPLGRPRCRGVYIIQMELKEIGWDCVGCSHLVQDRDQ
jgi:hypothetical protein